VEGSGGREPLVPPGPRREVEDELDFHLEMRVRQYVEEGLTPEEARRRALAGFRDLDRVKKECRTMARERDRIRGWTEGVDRLRQDLRYAFRQLRNAPAFTAVAVLTLALGIGATTAIFSAVDAALLSPLPYPGAGRLVIPQSQSLETGDTWYVNYADYLDWREADVFARVAVYQRFEVTVGAEGRDAERVPYARVTEDFFRTIGVAPALGRLPAPAEFQPGEPPFVILSHELWRRSFGGRPEAVGAEIRLGGRPVQVIGVLPRDLSFPADVDLWVPLRIPPDDPQGYLHRDNFNVQAVARLAAGRTLAQTRAELATLAARVASADPAAREGVTVTAEPLDDWLVGRDLSRALWFVLGAVGFVLLIGCVNVANLLLSRAAARKREFAVRGALGAGRGRLVRQLLTESLLLAVVGGLAGVALACAGVRVLIGLAPANLPRIAEASVNPTVLGFAFAVSLASAILFGLVPALTSAARDPREALAEGTLRGTAGVGGRRSRRVLVGVELALSVILLVGAGLLLRSFAELRATDPGFRTANLLTFSLSLQGERYTESAERERAFRAIRERVAGGAGVEDVAMASSLPLGGGGLYNGRDFLHDGQPEPPAGDDLLAVWQVVSPGYFATMDIPILAGREIELSDDAEAEPVAIVSREFARRMFGDEDPIGRRVRSWRDENVYRRIVGIADDVRMFGAGDELRPTFYVPYAQAPWSAMVIVVRTARDPAAVASVARAAVRELDPTLAVDDLQTMRSVWDTSIAPRRFGAVLLAAFAGLALVLALVGIFGLLNYGVSQRRREIGIRIAFGAARRDVERMVLAEAGGVLAAGLAAGLVGAYLLMRLAASLLYGVSAADPMTFAAVGVLLAGTALVASWIPAKRAAGVDPAASLRE